MPLTRMTARSKEGSKDTTVVWMKPGSVLDHRMGDAGDHVGVGDHQAGADDEARSLLDLSAPVADDLDRGGPGVGDRLLQLGAPGQGDRAGGRRGQLGEDRREALRRTGSSAPARTPTAGRAARRRGSG